MRHLQNQGADIIFETNGIDTRDAYSEMMLTVWAAFAQEESRSISENTKWGIRKRFEEGVARWCKIYGYRKGNDGSQYEIVPEEAANIRLIFALADRDYSDVPSAAAEHAQYLEAVMEDCGFQPYSGEWWHFSDTDSYEVEETFLSDQV